MGEVETVGVTDEVVEDGFGVARITDDCVPFIHGQLAGDDS